MQSTWVCVLGCLEAAMGRISGCAVTASSGFGQLRPLDRVEKVLGRET